MKNNREEKDVELPIISSKEIDWKEQKTAEFEWEEFILI